MKFKSLNEMEEYINEMNHKNKYQFQRKKIWSFKELKRFLKDIKYGETNTNNKKAKSIKFYCNFGTIYADKCFIGDDKIYFFLEDKLVFEKSREKTDDIEWSGETENASCSSSLLTYDYEQDIQYENYR